MLEGFPPSYAMASFASCCCCVVAASSAPDECGKLDIYGGTAMRRYQLSTAQHILLSPTPLIFIAARK
jgi:hypothetical protein